MLVHRLVAWVYHLGHGSVESITSRFYIDHTTVHQMWAPCNATCSINRRSSTHPVTLGTPETPIQLLMRHALISSNQSVHLSAKWHGPMSASHPCYTNVCSAHQVLHARRLSFNIMLPLKPVGLHSFAARSFAAVCLSADSFTCLLFSTLLMWPHQPYASISNMPP